MKKINNIILYKDIAYVNNRDTNITKDEIVSLFDNAFDEGCMNFKKEESEICTNYVFEQEQSKTIVTIPATLIGLNDSLIEKLESVLTRVEQLNEIEKTRQLRREKQEKINKLKKYAAIATLGATCVFALSKAAPVVEHIAEKIIEWDNENFERELEESGAKEMQQNFEMQKNHQEAMEHYYQDQKIEEQKQEQQISEFERQVEQLNQEYTQTMIENAKQYQDISTMPGVIPMDEYNASYEDTTEELPYIK